MAAFTWILPAGEYARRQEDGRTVLVPGSYHRVERSGQGIGRIFLAPVRGFVKAAEVVGFILFVGGAFGLIQGTGTLEALIGTLTRMSEQREIIRRAMIPFFMILFSLFGAVFGMSEEVIPFILIFVPLAVSLGYDVITGIAVPFLGAGLGFASAFMNPFTVGIAQGIAELPAFSGLTYRILAWVFFTAVGIAYVYRYAVRVQGCPHLSPVPEVNRVWQSARRDSGVQVLTRRQKGVLVLFGAGILILVVGVLRFRWYVGEIAALFLAIGVFSGLLGGVSANRMAELFVKGARNLVGAALIVAFARGILVIAEEGKIIDTILYSLSGGIRSVPPVLAGVVMFVVQTCINFFVPSGSGQAALTMPIMAPLSDLIGITRQTAVLAFQFGDGFTNMIIPTSAVTMGVLGVAGVPWEKWARWLLPLEVLLFILACLWMIPPVLFGWGPF